MTEDNRKQPILAFDTSTAALAAAIISGDEVLGEIQSFAERNHSVYIVTHLKQLLADCGVTEELLGAIAVGNGPGSYTGMRIAVSAAKTLAWVWNKPLIGVSSLEALAYGGWHHAARDESATLASVQQEGSAEWVLPIMDARRGQVYTGGYIMTAAGGWSQFAEDRIVLMKDWVEHVAALAAEPSANVARIWVAGDLSLHEAEAIRLRQLVEEAGIEVRLLTYELEGRWVAQLGSEKLRNGELSDTHMLIPNYTQLTEAERLLSAKSVEERP